MAWPGGHAFALDAGARPPSQARMFAIPSQSLGEALEAYARIAGGEVLYDGMLAYGRRSAAVDGVHSPARALQLLLEGTGLVAEFKDTGFFVLVPRAERPAAEAAGRPRPFYGRVQARLRTAFCGRIASGQHRVAARLWIGPSGEVVNEMRLGSTGDAAADREVDDILRRLHFGAPPPSDLRQPITIVVMPNGPGVRNDCQEDEAPGRAIAGGRP